MGQLDEDYGEAVDTQVGARRRDRRVEARSTRSRPSWVMCETVLQDIAVAQVHHRRFRRAQPAVRGRHHLSDCRARRSAASHSTRAMPRPTNSSRWSPTSPPTQARSAASTSRPAQLVATPAAEAGAVRAASRFDEAKRRRRGRVRPAHRRREAPSGRRRRAEDAAEAAAAAAAAAAAPPPSKQRGHRLSTVAVAGGNAGGNSGGGRGHPPPPAAPRPSASPVSGIAITAAMAAAGRAVPVRRVEPRRRVRLLGPHQVRVGARPVCTCRTSRAAVRLRAARVPGRGPAGRPDLLLHAHQPRGHLPRRRSARSTLRTPA